MNTLKYFQYINSNKLQHLQFLGAHKSKLPEEAMSKRFFVRVEHYHLHNVVWNIGEFQ